MKQKFIAIIAIIVIVALVASYTIYNTFLKPKPSIISEIKKRGYLIVGTSADFPPFEFVNKKGQIVGLDIDIAKKIADALGVKLVIKDMAFDALIPALLSKDVDIVIAGMTITKEREKMVAFSIPYFEADQAAVVLKSNNNIKNVSDLVGKIIGVQQGTTGDLWVTNNLVKKGLVKDDNVKRYDRVTIALLELKKGTVQVVIIDKPVAETYVKLDPSLKIAFVIKTGEKYGIAIRKSDKELLNLINKVLESMKQSGELEKLIKKWFG